MAIIAAPPGPCQQRRANRWREKERKKTGRRKQPVLLSGRRAPVSPHRAALGGSMNRRLDETRSTPPSQRQNEFFFATTTEEPPLRRHHRMAQSELAIFWHRELSAKMDPLGGVHICSTSSKQHLKPQPGVVDKTPTMFIRLNAL